MPTSGNKCFNCGKESEAFAYGYPVCSGSPHGQVCTFKTDLELRQALHKIYPVSSFVFDKKVSVVVPCYKYAHFLKECVESIRAQTYPVHEIIVVNDGSPDNTSEVAKELGVILVEKPNGGLSSARNAGIKIATGDYIMCLDADDKLVPGAIEEHVRLMDDDMTIAQCGLMEFGERHIVMVPQETNLTRIMQSNTVYCNAMFSKKAWELSGGYDESEVMRLGYEDWLYWLELLALGCHVNTSDFIALRYRVHQNNMTKETTHPNRHKLYDYIYNKHRDLYEKYDLKIAGMALKE